MASVLVPTKTNYERDSRSAISYCLVVPINDTNQDIYILIVTRDDYYCDTFLHGHKHAWTVGSCTMAQELQSVIVDLCSSMTLIETDIVIPYKEAMCEYMEELLGISDTEIYHFYWDAEDDELTIQDYETIYKRMKVQVL